MKKSFLQRDDVLLDPAPELDPENEHLDESAAVVEERHGSVAQRDGSLVVENRRRIFPAVDVDGVKYKGTQVLRKELHAEGSDDDADSFGSSDLDDDSEKLSGEEQRSSRNEGLDEFSQSDSSGDGSYGSDSEFEEGNGAGSELSGSEEDDVDVAREDSEKLQKKLEQIRKQEQQEVLRLQHERQKEAKQASVVKEQKALYESLLSLRIRLQGPLSKVNTLPLAGDPLRSRCSEDFAKANEAVLSLASKLVHLQRILESAKTASSAGVDYQDVNKLSRKVIDQHDSLKRKREEVLDEWNSKIAGGASKSNKFKVLDQSANSQIRTVLQDRDRLMKRTRLKRTFTSRIGADDESSQYDEETYDDGDFYQTLLREVTGGDFDDGIKDVLRIRRARGSSKKSVDRKASKGRKLRFHVHEKLVGFLAPAPFEPPPALDELLAGLFKS
mmetsp:Transcript_911/g.2888  ORF Transcript_911/g.2888 Transcript_911/m.2888 type:complete len:443 (-) Transcript_911:49-1377(-)